MKGTGALAKSLAGHDKGDLFVIIEETREYVFLVDGKFRPFGKPKRKNKKHIQVIYDWEQQKRKNLIKEGKLTDEEVRRFIRCYKRESQV